MASRREALFSAARDVDQIHPIHSRLPECHMTCAGKSPQLLLQQPRSEAAGHSRPSFISIIFFCEFAAFLAFLILTHADRGRLAVENDRNFMTA